MHDAQIVDDLVDIEEACRIIGGADTPIHASTYNRGVRSGIYPAPFKMGPQLRRYSRAELIAVRERARAERDEKHG